MSFCTELETGKDVRDRSGSAAVVAIVAVVVLVGLCGAMLMIATRSADERVATVDRHQALAAAHAGSLALDFELFNDVVHGGSRSVDLWGWRVLPR